MDTWNKQRKRSDEVKAKLEGKVSDRVKLLIARFYLWGWLEKPLEELSDVDFLWCDGCGVKTLQEIRKVIPAPER